MITYNGQEVVIVNPIRRSAKTHRMRPNGKLSYHERIQKKWDKRYGYEWFEVMSVGEIKIDKLAGKLYMNQKTFNKLSEMTN